jgi:spore coat polysaccharide biosynthesis protein SpsF (cytidylyltransferase family)
MEIAPADCPLWSKKTTAHMLGDISERSVDYLVASNQIESRRIGRRVMILRTSALAYAKADRGPVNPKRD